MTTPTTKMTTAEDRQRFERDFVLSPQGLTARVLDSIGDNVREIVQTELDPSIRTEERERRREKRQRIEKEVLHSQLHCGLTRFSDVMVLHPLSIGTVLYDPDQPPNRTRKWNSGFSKRPDTQAGRVRTELGSCFSSKAHMMPSLFFRWPLNVPPTLPCMHCGRGPEKFRGCRKFLAKQYMRETDTWVVWGNFCDFPCALRYEMERSGASSGQVVMYTQMFAVRVYNRPEADGPIVPAPSHDQLLPFGPIDMDAWEAEDCPYYSVNRDPMTISFVQLIHCMRYSEKDLLPDGHENPNGGAASTLRTFAPEITKSHNERQRQQQQPKRKHDDDDDDGDVPTEEVKKEERDEAEDDDWKRPWRTMGLMEPNNMHSCPRDQFAQMLATTFRFLLNPRLGNPEPPNMSTGLGPHVATASSSARDESQSVEATAAKTVLSQFHLPAISHMIVNEAESTDPNAMLRQICNDAHLTVDQTPYARFLTNKQNKRRRQARAEEKNVPTE